MTTGDPRDMGNYMIDHKPFAGKDALGNIVDPDDIQGIKKWHEVDQSGVWEGDEWEPKPEVKPQSLYEYYEDLRIHNIKRNQDIKIGDWSERVQKLKDHTGDISDIGKGYFNPRNWFPVGGVPHIEHYLDCPEDCDDLWEVKRPWCEECGDKHERDQCKLDEAYTLTEHDHFKINVGVVCAKLNDLLPKKNLAYGNSYVKVPSIMKILYPNGIPLEKYDDALAIVRVMDKVCRIVESNDPLGENPWFDIAGYGVLMSVIGGKNE